MRYNINNLINQMNNPAGGRTRRDYLEEIAPLGTTFTNLLCENVIIVSGDEFNSRSRFVKEVYRYILDTYNIRIDDDNSNSYNLQRADENERGTIQRGNAFYRIHAFTGTNTGPVSALTAILYLFKNIRDNNNINIDEYEIEIETGSNVENDIDRNANENEEEVMGINTQLDRILKQHKQVILTGAPGTGKTYSAKEYVNSKIQDDDQKKFVQFHPSYDYSDFVEGIRPIEINNKMEFVKLDGHFKAFCREAARAENAEKNFYFIIDEINRADLSKVFGELMYGLEEEYREEKFKTQYNNLPSYDSTGERINNDTFIDGFYIPKNVYIIGTMNDIDRSVESFDFALRRRFQWYEVKANDVMKDVIESKFNQYLESHNSNMTEVHRNAIDFIVNQMKAMNTKISTEGTHFGLNESYHIGPAYVTKDNVMEVIYGCNDAIDNDAKDRIVEVLLDTFENNIKPLLKEYVRGRKGAENFITNVKSALETYHNEMQESNDQITQNSNQDGE